MTDTIEVVQRILSVVAAVLYAYVGYRTGRRRVVPEARGALRAWQAWWYGLALVSAAGLVLGPMLEGNRSVTVFLAVLLPFLVLIVAIIAALVYYLLYLYTGSNRVLRYVVVYAVALTAFYALLLSGAFSPPGYPAFEPDETGEETFHLEPEGEDRLGTVSFVAGLFLTLPILAGAFAYMRLFWKLEGATERFRIAMVSGAFIVWFGTSFLSTLYRQATDALPEWWSIVSSVIGLLAAVGVLTAYFPPRAWQKKYGLRSLSDETA